MICDVVLIALLLVPQALLAGLLLSPRGVNADAARARAPTNC